MTRAFHLGAATMAAIVGLAAGPALGQTLSREDLVLALGQRDAAIAALEKRIAALEAERSAPLAVPAAAVAPIALLAPWLRDPRDVGQAAAADGDDEALQAISRGLIERGALVLAPWSAEITPSLAYNHSIKQGLVLVDTPEGISTVTDQRLRDDGLQAMVGLRLGLPWRSQLEVRVPYGWRGEGSSLGDGSHKTLSAFGVGDAEIEFSHQFLSEGAWRPDLVGAVTWRLPTGADPLKTTHAAVMNGAGAYEGVVRLTALKSVDPIVFFTSLSYGASLAIHESFGRVRPGDAIDLLVGALLSLSPSTSLSVSLLQGFRAPTTIDGAAIAGSDQVAAIVQFGVDQVITRRMLLDVSLGVGVTRDAPNYTFLVSLPIRFH